jgi:hypothetical protein
MAYLIGIVLAFSVSVMATLIGFDRDRAFYPTVLIVIASYYALFAVEGGATGALLPEILIAMAFLVVALLGFRRNLWLVAGALFAHGVLDFFHDRVVTNPGVPAWWPAFCLGYDVAAAGFLAWLLLRRPPILHSTAERASDSVAENPD